MSNIIDEGGASIGEAEYVVWDPDSMVTFIEQIFAFQRMLQKLENGINNLERKLMWRNWK